ncbi:MULTISPECIES: MMPL family transporter [unclassified Micromonospora]|uniref:MMPL family transporter n=1 Tax=unclassified Micromonospora TaxID=2617518 RepID=UPI001B359D90|nr:MULTISPECIES: MMPL family transporter [unclassified Micromonospora]MBQ1043898.1 MMPL family transporter [Micromonospora sp. C72]MBQ1057563.1 MMPL family transporter [Micromonospora sp. C32]
MIRAVTRFARRRPAVVLVIWLVIAAAGFTVGNGVFARMTTSVGAIAGSESQQGAQALGDAKLAPPVINAVISGGPATDPAFRTKVSAALTELRAIDGVLAVTDPFGPQAPVATDGAAVLVNVELAHQGDVLADKVRTQLTGIDGATAVVSGGPLTDREFNDQATSDTRRAEIVSAPLLLLLLLLVFMSLIAAGLPLLIALVGVGGTFSTLLVMSFFTDVSIYSIQVTTMLAIGLGVDYALLMVSRFREERALTEDAEEALVRASERAGRTIVFSGLTIAVSLASLVVFADPFLRSIGVAGAAVVLIDMLAAITLLPALLQLLRNRIKPGRARKERGRSFAAVARGVQKMPVLTLLVVLVGLIVAGLWATDLRLDTSNPRSLPADSATRQLTEELREHFPALAGPSAITIVARTSADDPDLAEFRQRVAAVPGVSVVNPGRSGGELAVLQATPKNPTSDPDTAQAVRDIRDLDAPFTVQVTGDAARLVDYQQELRDRLPIAGGIVLLATFVLLLAFTRSVLIPLKAVLTNLLSLFAALGVVVWVFQEGHLVGLLGGERLDGIDLTVPVVVAAIAFGLSTDYEVFVLSRIRERRFAGATPDQAVREGLQRSGGIVTAAALLLAVTFAGFMTGGFAPIKEVGLGLVLAVLIDAVIVRMLLVPATMAILGRAAWWAPRFLGGRPQVPSAPETGDARPELTATVQG